MSPIHPDADVAVVGLGPVGGILTNLLGLDGLSVAAFDREPEAPDLPRGVGMDAEMMRVVQTLGLAEELEPRLKVFRGAQYLDVDGNVVSTRPPVSGIGPQGWPARYNVHQPEFEAVMRHGLMRRPAVTPYVGYEVVAVEERDGIGVLTARERATGAEITRTARYVVGCDGARSLVRKTAGFALDDFGLNQPWIVADFKVDPSADLPGINTHFADPETPAIYIHVVRDLRRFEFRAKPGEDLTRAVEPDRIWARVARWLRPDQATLLRGAVYTHRSLVADRWQSGALVVAGDAAHQTPPFLGQGLCTGVRDAASLAWRLRSVVRDGADPGLLASYESERSAHARFFIQTATTIGGELTNPDKARIDALNKRIGREGSGATPRLGEGLFDPAGPGGTLAPQPRLADGTRLDDVVGYRFAIVTGGPLDVPTAALAQRAGFAVVTASGEALDWLAELGATAAVVRPDRYYYGAYADPVALAEAVRELARVVAPRAVEVPA